MHTYKYQGILQIGAAFLLDIQLSNYIWCKNEGCSPHHGKQPLQTTL